MEKVIVAFENERTGERVKELLESSGTAACLLCRSAAEVKRVVNKQGISTVVCGYKFPDGTAESLFEDLPSACVMLMVAPQDLLTLCANADIFQLAAPVSKGDLVASVRMLTQIGHRLARFVRPKRKEEEVQVIQQAKALLMDRHGMTEEQAHRFLQKQSMDTGAKMVQTAKLILASA